MHGNQGSGLATLRSSTSLLALLVAACAPPTPPPAAPTPCVAATPVSAPSAEARAALPNAGAAPPSEATCNAQPAAGLPLTPVGEAFAAWLGAFNAGTRTCLSAYAAKYEKTLNVDEGLDFRTETGGFEVRDVVKSTPSYLIVRLKERSGRFDTLGRARLASESPIAVKGMRFQIVKPGDVIDDFVLDGAERASVVKEIAVQLRSNYVLPDVAEQMAQAIERKNAEHGYDSVADPDEFADLLEKDLRNVSHDRHVEAQFSSIKYGKGAEKKDDPEVKARTAKWLRSENCGFLRVERLEGNIGYIKFNMFGEPDVCGDTAKAAMALVADTNAIVFDVRDNGGGNPSLLAILASYLFHDRTHLNDIYMRPTKVTKEFWTNPSLPGAKSDKKPVYVLTSKRTFSCAEEFTYDLKTLKRATIVGETTGGGAHPSRFARLDDHFGLIIPFARAINPITKTDWEGVGVEPDVKVDAKDALEKAVEMVKEGSH